MSPRAASRMWRATPALLCAHSRDRVTRVAVYEGIAGSLRDRIRCGEFSVGDRLPSISSLRGEYAVAGVNTIRAAHRVLIKEGMLAAEQGRGVFVTENRVPDRTGEVLLVLESAQAALTQAIASLRALQSSPPERKPARLPDGPGAQPGKVAEAAGPESASALPEACPESVPRPRSGAAPRPLVGDAGRYWYVVEADHADDAGAPVVVLSLHRSEKAALAARARSRSRHVAESPVQLQVRRGPEIVRRLEWDPERGRGVVRDGPAG